MHALFPKVAPGLLSVMGDGIRYPFVVAWGRRPNDRRKACTKYSQLGAGADVLRHSCNLFNLSLNFGNFPHQ